jgi:hypothetical protein
VLRRFRDRLGSHTQALKTLQGSLERKDQEITNLRSRLENKDERLEKLRGRLKAREQTLKVAKHRLQTKEQALAELQEQMASNRNSPNATSGDAPVFFLVGQAKSGTSWLMRMLNAHPEILCSGEGRFFGRDYKREDVKRMWPRVQPSSLYRAILDAEYLNAWIERSVWTRDDDKDEHLDNLTHLAVEYFLTEQLSKAGKSIVGDKTPFIDDETVGEIKAIYPEARVIHLIRDGRDAAVSAMHHLWNYPIGLGGLEDLEPEEYLKRDAYREDPQRFLQSEEGLFTEKRIRNLAGVWSTNVSRAMEEGPKLLGENYTEVRYEELLERPDEELKNLLEFLGADAREETIERCVGLTSFERWTKGRERGQEDSTVLLRKGISGDWRNSFTERDREIFKEVAGDTLVRLGYEEDREW